MIDLPVQVGIRDVRPVRITLNWLTKTKATAPSKAEQLGLVSFYSAGIPFYSPLAWMFLESLNLTLSNMLVGIGYLKVDLPLLQSRQDWVSSGRFDTYQEKFLTGPYVLASTAEEVAAIYAERDGSKGKRFFQISKKFRDEKRPRTLCRCREFIMKDAYSFHTTREEALSELVKVSALYRDFFALLDLPIKVAKSSDTAMGGDFSFEFMYLDSSGEGGFWPNEGEELGMYFDGTDCGPIGLHQSCHEMGHIFYLGDRYSRVLHSKSNLDSLQEACSYGIGMTRLFEILVRKNNGLCWKSLRRDWRAVVIGDLEISFPYLRLDVRRGSNYNFPFTFAEVYFKGVPLIWSSGREIKVKVEGRELSFGSISDLESNLQEWI